ncbi:MAG: A/G-specific adenine glycosylase [Acidobacteriia bacterium]|nr:A/G-specific adenine glycosylase [Terriglobia bacterium]MBV8902245.1 A/G-specific adenine glycosylase [Terriglobia bacterium]
MGARPRVKPSIADALADWYRRGHRDLPWRHTSDPYCIWVSEVMLQQTRAQAVIPYYERFLARFPTVEALAASAEEEVLALWSGLGYYSRARNLRRAARQIQASGGFPYTYERIRTLPGIGDYTAAAIASIAFGLPHAVVDGNVLRVVARVENDSSDIASAPTRERFRKVAQAWLEESVGSAGPGLFNQALMELGATVCLGRNPMCLVCPLASACGARVHGTAGGLPVKLRTVELVQLERTLLVVRRRSRVLLRRIEADARRMPGFWELPATAALPQARIGAVMGQFRHSITYHRYLFTVAHASVRLPSNQDGVFRWFAPAEVASIPLSTTARKALHMAGIL